MQKLVPGEEFEVEHPTKKDMKKVRGLLYDWMHHISQDHSIYTDDRPNHWTLRIERDKEPQFSIKESAPSVGDLGQI